jgi:hypothetical protein
MVDWSYVIWTASMIPVMAAAAYLGVYVSSRSGLAFWFWAIMLGLPTVYTFAVFGMLGHFD